MRRNTIAIITAFEPVEGQLRCACGVEVRSYALRRQPDGSAFLTCRACKQLLAETAADLTIDPDDDACPF